jgi:hypothetical protein
MHLAVAVTSNSAFRQSIEIGLPGGRLLQVAQAGEVPGEGYHIGESRRRLGIGQRGRDPDTVTGGSEKLDGFGTAARNAFADFVLEG